MLFATSFANAQQPVLTKVGTYKCGRQPKQVLFSPDSKYVIMPLLDDNGFDEFSVQEKKIIKRINPPNAAKVGFAEGLFIPEKNTFLVSQMTTANVYEYSYPDFELKRTIPTTGNWSKFIARFSFGSIFPLIHIITQLRAFFQRRSDFLAAFYPRRRTATRQRVSLTGSSAAPSPAGPKTSSTVSVSRQM